MSVAAASAFTDTSYAIMRCIQPRATRRRFTMNPDDIPIQFIARIVLIHDYYANRSEGIDPGHSRVCPNTARNTIFYP
jgi:hypothetical protein